MGYLTVLRKHIYYFIHRKPVILCFDLAVFVNMTFLTLEGILDERIISQCTDFVTCLLLLEILLKMLAYNPSKI